VSRVCQEFQCLPSAAKRELEDDPERMAEQILSIRAYAETKRVYDEHSQRGDQAGELPQLPLMALVVRNEFERQRARAADARKRG
jgi:hypothetical protein